MFERTITTVLFALCASLASSWASGNPNQRASSQWVETGPVLQFQWPSYFDVEIDNANQGGALTLEVPLPAPRTWTDSTGYVSPSFQAAGGTGVQNIAPSVVNVAPYIPTQAQSRTQASFEGGNYWQWTGAILPGITDGAGFTWNFTVSTCDRRLRTEFICETATDLADIPSVLQTRTAEIGAAMPGAIQQVAATAIRQNTFLTGALVQMSNWVKMNIAFNADASTEAIAYDDIPSLLASGEGDSVQQASVFCAIANTAGIPARIVEGRTSSPGFYMDTQTGIEKAIYGSAWVEVYLPHIGWAEINPTSGAESSNPFYIPAGYIPCQGIQIKSNLACNESIAGDPPVDAFMGYQFAPLADGTTIPTDYGESANQMTGTAIIDPAQTVPPSVAPTSGTVWTVAPGQPVLLSATAAVSDSVIRDVFFSANSPNYGGAGPMTSYSFSEPYESTFTPYTAGQYIIQASADDGRLDGENNANALITINCVGGITGTNPLPYIYSAPPVLPPGTTLYPPAGDKFHYPVAAAGNPTAVSVGGLPSAFSFDSSTLFITGSMQPGMNVTLPVTAVSPAGQAQSYIAFAGTSGPVITSAGNVGATPGQAMRYQVACTQAAAFSETGLPAGLGIDPATGLISGTPSASGTYTVTVTGSNAGGTAVSTLYLSVESKPSVTPATLTLVLYQAMTPYQIAATNSPYNYTATGLPAGVSIDGLTGILSGTPTATGTFPVTVHATNANGAGTATITLAVPVPYPTVSNASVKVAINQEFSYQVVTTNDPTDYEATGLPAGLGIDPNSGVIYGSPLSAWGVTPGVYKATVQVSNDYGTASATITVTVTGGETAGVHPAVKGATLKEIVNTAVNYRVLASQAPTQFAVDTLPPGLSIDPTSGIISGTPTATGAFSTEVQASNAYGTGQATIRFLVSVPPLPSAAYSSTLVDGSGNVVGASNLAISAGGALSGSVNVNGVSYRVAGRLGLDGSFTTTVSTPEGPVQVVIQTAGGAGGTVSVTATVGGETFSGVAQRPELPATPPAPGRYTFLIPPVQNLAGVPSGYGYGVLTLNTKGAITITGRLNDGRPFSARSALRADSSFPLFVQPYGKDSLLAGSVVFADIPRTSDFSSTLTWLRPETKKAPGVSTTVNLIGSAYAPPAKGTPVSITPDNGATFEANYALPAPGDQKIPLTITSNPRLSAGGLNLSLNPSCGLFSGKITVNGRGQAFAGAILQKQTMGGGAIPTLDGWVEIEP